MSRNIAPKSSLSLTEEETEARRSDKDRLLLTSCQGKNCALLIQNGQLMEASFFSKDPGRIGLHMPGKKSGEKYRCLFCGDQKRGDLFSSFEKCRFPLALKQKL